MRYSSRPQTEGPAVHQGGLSQPGAGIREGFLEEVTFEINLRVDSISEWEVETMASQGQESHEQREGEGNVKEPIQT